jgi:hypothetical protein
MKKKTTLFDFGADEIGPAFVSNQVDAFLFGDLDGGTRKQILLDLTNSLRRLVRKEQTVEIVDWCDWVTDKLFEASPEFTAAKKDWEDANGIEPSPALDAAAGA